MSGAFVKIWGGTLNEVKIGGGTIFYTMTEARCVVAGDINSTQNNHEISNILYILLTVTYTSTTHTEHIVAFPLKKNDYANTPQCGIIRTLPLLFNTVWTVVQSDISGRKFTWLTAYFFFCFMKKIHSWYGETGEDTCSKISCNTKKTITEGPLGRQDASHVKTVQQMQVSSGDSVNSWHRLITVWFPENRGIAKCTFSITFYRIFKGTV